MKQAIKSAAFLCVTSLIGCSQQERVDAGNKTDQAARTAGAAIKDAGATVSDSGITVRVKTAMSLSGKLNTSKIDVDTKNRIVYIRGTVAKSEHKALAERIAKDTVAPGVMVVNQLKIGGATKQ